MNYFCIASWLTTLTLIIAFPHHQRQYLFNPITDCASYLNDLQVLRGFNFSVHLPLSDVVTSAKLVDVYSVERLAIIDRPEFPTTLFCLRSLRYLTIDNTPVDQIFQQIEYLPSSLVSLTIKNTQLTCLPQEISRLTKLERLTIINTSLEKVPSSLDSLKSLKFLDFRNNRLYCLPETVLQSPQIETIDLTHNPIDQQCRRDLEELRKKNPRLIIYYSDDESKFKLR